MEKYGFFSGDGSLFLLEWMNMRKVFRCLITVWVFFLPSSPVFSQESVAELNHGYALLNNVTSESKNTGMIFFIKSATQEVQILTSDVDKIMSSIASELSDWANEDSSLDINQTGLPQIEVKARKFDASSTQKLLMNASGTRFNTMLVVVNFESVSYTTDLVNALVQIEANPERHATLQEWASNLEALQGRIVDTMLSTARK